MKNNDLEKRIEALENKVGDFKSRVQWANTMQLFEELNKTNARVRLLEDKLKEKEKKRPVIDWFKKNKKSLLKTLLILAIIATIAVSAYFILRACGFTTQEKWEQLRKSLGENVGFWAIVVLLQVIQVIFIPVSNQVISAPLALIFTNDLWKLFLSSWIGISIGTVILYFIGKYGGEKICNWVLGDKEKTQKMKTLMQSGKGFFILGDLIPFLPNDILTTLSGLAGYNFFFVLIVTLITRAICIATTVYIVGNIKTYPWLIAILVVGALLMILATILVTKRAIKKNKELKDERK